MGGIIPIDLEVTVFIEKENKYFFKSKSYRVTCVQDLRFSRAKSFLVYFE